MADIDDRWYRLDKATGTRVPTDRHGTGMRWLARWRDGEQQRRKSFSKRSDAEKFLAQVTADLSRGVYVDVRAGRVTVKQYGERWRSEQLHRDSTAEHAERMFRLHIDPILGGLQLAQVRSGHLKAWVKDRSAALAPSTLRVVYSYVSAMFSRAVVDRLIGISPCVDVRLPEVEHRELIIPTPEQVHALAAALPQRYQAIPYVAASTGLRGGEIFGLELPDTVDFLRREARLVFTNEWGQPIHRASWSHVWALAVRKVDLPAGFGLHGLRDFFATSLIHAGASVKTVQLALGHSTPMITLNTYVGEWPEAVDRTRTIIDGTLGVPRMCPEKRAAR